MERQESKAAPARREPRLGQTTAREKAEALRAVIGKELQRLRKMTPTRPRVSPALTALEPLADEIRALLEEGWSANAIATEIAKEHEGGYSVETLRNAIKRIANAKPGSSVTLPRPSATATVSMKSDTTTHAGFAEDPR